MRCPALLDVDGFDAEAPGETIRSDQRRISFAKRNNVLVLKFGKNDFFLRPHTAQPAQAGIEELFPLRSGSLLKGIDVVAHLEQTTARLASVNDLIEAISDTTTRETFEPRMEVHESEGL